MDFIDYCVATKNYSALNTVNEYVKTFSGEIGKGIKYGLGFGVGMAGLGLGLGALKHVASQQAAKRMLANRPMPESTNTDGMNGDATDDVDA